MLSYFTVVKPPPVVDFDVQQPAAGAPSATRAEIVIGQRRLAELDRTGITACSSDHTAVGTRGRFFNRAAARLATGNASVAKSPLNDAISYIESTPDVVIEQRQQPP